MKRLTKKEREAWKALYSPGVHLELGVEDWRQLAEEAEAEYAEIQLGKLLGRIPFPEEGKAA